MDILLETGFEVVGETLKQSFRIAIEKG